MISAERWVQLEEITRARAVGQTITSAGGTMTYNTTTSAGWPRPFRLRREVDESGISGVGDVAEGVEFTDGSVALRWRGTVRSTVVYSSMDDVVAIHGHGGKTRIVWSHWG